MEDGFGSRVRLARDLPSALLCLRDHRRQTDTENTVDLSRDFNPLPAELVTVLFSAAAASDVKPPSKSAVYAEIHVARAHRINQSIPRITSEALITA